MELQQQLQEKYNACAERLKKLEAVSKEDYKTNGNFRYNPTNGYSSVDIPSTHNEAELIHAFAFIKNKSEQYHAAAAEIGLKQYPLFKWCGFVPEDWYHDIKLRFLMLKHGAEITKLNTAMDKMRPYLPEENKIKQLLLEIGD